MNPPGLIDGVDTAATLALDGPAAAAEMPPLLFVRFSVLVATPPVLPLLARFSGEANTFGKSGTTGGGGESNAPAPPPPAAPPPAVPAMGEEAWTRAFIVPEPGIVLRMGVLGVDAVARDEVFDGGRPSLEPRREFGLLPELSAWVVTMCATPPATGVAGVGAFTTPALTPLVLREPATMAAAPDAPGARTKREGVVGPAAGLGVSRAGVDMADPAPSVAPAVVAAVLVSVAAVVVVGAVVVVVPD